MTLPRPEIPLFPFEEKIAKADGKIQLMLGGPGSGRTHTLVARAAILLKWGEKPENIALIATTVHGPDDLRRRLMDLPTTRAVVDRMFVGTPEQYAARLLRTSGHPALGLPAHFTIWDRRSADAVFAGLVIKEIAPVLDVNLKPRDIRRAHDWYRHNMARFDHDQLAAEELWWRQAILRYVGEKRRQGVLDMDDLVDHAVRAMALDPGQVGIGPADRARHMLVDDLQEINPGHYSFLKSMIGSAASATFTATPNGRLGLHPGQHGDLLRYFDLEHPPNRRLTVTSPINFRCSQEVTAASQAFLNSAEASSLIPAKQGSIHPPRWLPRLLEFQGSPQDMYVWVVEEICRLHDKDGIAWKEMAVIFRSRSTFDHLRTLAINAGVPYTLLGISQPDRSGDVGATLAMLGCALNPHDLSAFAAAASTGPREPRGLNPADADQALQRSQQDGTDLIRASGALLSQYEPGSQMHRDLVHVTETWAALQGILEHPQEGTVPNMIALVVANLRRARGNPRETAPPSLLRLYGEARNTPPSGNGPRADLAAFLDRMNPDLYVDRLAREDARAFPPRQTVTFTTVRHAVGLEWRTVFLVDASDGTFPALTRYDAPDRRQAEQGLWHVATTRVRDRLIMCYSRRSGPARNARPSRFLDPIGDDLLDRVVMTGPGPILSR